MDSGHASVSADDHDQWLQQDHQVHYIKIGPDGLLYANQGSPSNTGPCPKFGPIDLCSIVRMELNGSNPETYAYGEPLCLPARPCTCRSAGVRANLAVLCCALQ